MMSDPAVSTDGYVTAVPYPLRYYRELNPHAMRFVIAGNGIAPPDLAPGYTCMELGFGRGLSLAVNAAANPNGRFFGVDFMPEHVAGAASLGRGAGVSNLDVRCAAFADLERLELPAFDVIAMHGVWSWISAENRRHIRAFIARKLKPNGVVYIGYNAMPGWLPMLPLREIMKAQFDRTAGSVETKVAAAKARGEALRTARAAFFESNPKALQRLKQIEQSSADYLAHEYFNDDWHPFYFGDVAADMEGLGLSFVGSAKTSSNMDALNVTSESRALVDAARDVVERETLKDFVANRQFRRDLFMRAPRALDPAMFAGLVGKTMVARLTTPDAAVAMALETPAGTFKPGLPLHREIVAALSAGPRPIGDLANTLMSGQPADTLINAVYFLVALGAVEVAGGTASRAAAEPRCRALNRALRDSGDEALAHRALASPVLGGAVELPLFEFLFVATRESGGAAAAIEILRRNGRALQREGKPLAGGDAVAELARRFAVFETERMPIYRELDIA